MGISRYGEQRPKSQRADFTPIQEGVEALATTIIAHINVDNLDFREKAIYMAIMTRRVIMTMDNPKMVDDRDYVGNKRLELAGQLMSLLFEDLFKTFNSTFKEHMDKLLRKRRLDFRV